MLTVESSLPDDNYKDVQYNSDFEGLVPHLTSVFGLDRQSQINLDPIVIAVACLVKTRRALQPIVSATELLKKGSLWIPQRTVSTLQGEQTRLQRFAKAYPTVFAFEADTGNISLKPGGLFSGEPDSCDESWYIICLHRLMGGADRELVVEILDELEVSRSYYFPQRSHEAHFATSFTVGSVYISLREGPSNEKAQG